MKPQEAAQIIEKRQARDRAIAAAYADMANDPEMQRVNPRTRIRELETENARLRAELAEARLTAEEAWCDQ